MYIPLMILQKMQAGDDILYDEYSKNEAQIQDRTGRCLMRGEVYICLGYYCKTGKRERGA